MTLDYTKECVNFRDVGEFVNLLAGRELLQPGKLLRNGKIDFVTDAKEIGAPETIINLRNSADIVSFGAEILQFPISNDYEKYNTADKAVRRWLNDVIGTFADSAYSTESEQSIRRIVNTCSGDCEQVIGAKRRWCIYF